MTYRPDDDLSLLQRVQKVLAEDVAAEIENLVANLREPEEMRDAQGHIRGLRRAIYLIDAEIHPPEKHPFDEDEEN